MLTNGPCRRRPHAIAGKRGDMHEDLRTSSGRFDKAESSIVVPFDQGAMGSHGRVLNSVSRSCSRIAMVVVNHDDVDPDHRRARRQSVTFQVGAMEAAQRHPPTGSWDEMTVKPWLPAVAFCRRLRSRTAGSWDRYGARPAHSRNGAHPLIVFGPEVRTVKSWQHTRT